MPLLMMLFSRNGIKIIKTHDESYALTFLPLMKPYHEDKKKKEKNVPQADRVLSTPPILSARPQTQQCVYDRTLLKQ